MDGIKLLCDLFANVPGPDDTVGKAGGRIAEINAIVKSIATNVGLPPDKIAIETVGFEEKAEAEIRQIEGQIKHIMGVEQFDDGGYKYGTHKDTGCRFHQYSFITFGIHRRYLVQQRPNDKVWVCYREEHGAPIAVDCEAPDENGALYWLIENCSARAQNVRGIYTYYLSLSETLSLLNLRKEKIGGYLHITDGSGKTICRVGNAHDVWPELRRQGYISHDSVSNEDGSPVVSSPPSQKSSRELLAEEISGDLGMFTGSCGFTKWSILFRNDTLTDGTKYLAEKAGCYWLMDLIASVQNLPRLKRNDFQVWYVVVCHAPFTQPRPWEWGPDGTELEECSGRWAWVWCEDGREKENSVIYTQLVPFTDFPLANIEVERQPPARDPDRERGAFKLYANRNELGGITILLPSEY